MPRGAAAADAPGNGIEPVRRQIVAVEPLLQPEGGDALEPDGVGFGGLPRRLFGGRGPRRTFRSEGLLSMDCTAARRRRRCASRSGAIGRREAPACVPFAALTGCG